MPFEWGEFSDKALRSIDESTARINLWEGAVRSSKTISSVIRWLEYVKTAPTGDLLMAAKTERTLKRNILDPITQIVGRKRFRYNRGLGEASLFGRNIYISGASDARSEGKIRGITLAGAYGDELTLWPEDVFKMAMTRLSVDGAKFFGTTNPDGPFHWLKTGYLDRAHELDLRSWHFELADNPNLPAAYVDALKLEYTGLWYKRFILGAWVMAEGAIYDMFDDAGHVVDKLPEMRRYWVGGDYGTSNPTAFVLIGESVDGRLYACREWRWDGRANGRQMTDVDVSAAYRKWISDVVPDRIYLDPSAASLSLQMWRDGVRGIKHAENAVVDGIRSVASLLSADRLRIHRSCEALLSEFPSYAWDPKAQERGEDKPIKQADHSLDALRYALHSTRRHWRHLVAMPTKEAA